MSAALSLGLDNYDLLDMRSQTIPGGARFFSAGRGITMPEPGRITVPHWITTEEEGRKAVQELAAKKVDIVKLWVDTRDDQYKKVPPEIYGPIIDEAHKQGLRIIAHIFNMEDAKGLMRAGIDAFAHGVRDRDVDDETIEMFKARPNLILVPNLPDRGVRIRFGRSLNIATVSSSTSLSRTPCANASIPARISPLASDMLKMCAVILSPRLCASSMIGP